MLRKLIGIFLCFVCHLSAQEVPYWQNQTPENVDTQIEEGAYPPGRFLASMASYGENSEKQNETSQIILFGGFGNPFTISDDFSDTWSWKFDSQTQAGHWIKLNPRVIPEQRSGAAMASNPHGEMILFGGLQSYSSFGFTFLLNDTWEYDAPNNTWNKLINYYDTSSPSQRFTASFVYDQRSGKYILFGGFDDSGFLNDTWAFDRTTNQWTNVSPTDSPVARSGAVMAADSQGRIVLFGGENNSGPLNDTWRLLYDEESQTYSWEQLFFTGAQPSPRSGATMAFDPNIEHKFILFGGNTGTPTEPVFSDETWGFDFDAISWTNLTEDLKTTSPSYPQGRQLATMAFDFIGRQMILFAGEGETGILKDTHALIGIVEEPIVREAFQKTIHSAMRAKRCRHCPLMNVIRLRAPKEGAPIVAFRIFRDKELQHLIAEIPSSQHRFTQRVAPCKNYKYYIQSVDALGVVSAPTFVKIKGKKKHCP